MTRHGFWRLGVDRHVGHQRHRDRALGHSRQIARRAGLAPARRQGARPSAHLHPSRPRRHEGGLREHSVERRSSSAAASSRRPATTPSRSCSSPTRTTSRRPRRSTRSADMVGALRDAVGPDVDIMVDFHGRPASVNAAMDYIRALEPARIMFAEEPLPPEDVAGLAHITAALAGADRVRRAAGRPPRIRAVDRARAPSTSPSPTSAIPAGCSRPRRSPPWPKPPASGSPRTIRSGRSPASPRCISAYRRPTSSSRRRCRARCPGTTRS